MMNGGFSEFTESLAQEKCQNVLHVWYRRSEARGCYEMSNEHELESKRLNELFLWGTLRRP